MTLKRLSLVAMLMVLSAVSTALMASPAQAELVEITCTSQQRAQYSPGVTLTPTLQNIRLKATAGPCVSMGDPAITSGSAMVTLQGVRSCLSLDQNTAGTSALTWNTGETTVYEYTSVTATVGGQVVVTILGTVIAGPFTGDQITIVQVSPVINLLDCLFPPGIRSRTGVGTLVITSLD